MRGHAIAGVVWVGLLAGGWMAFAYWGQHEAPVRGCEDRGGTREIVVDTARDGHFYLEGAVNGVPVRFLIDTGASYVTVDPGAALRAGLPTGLPAYFSTANGRVEGRLVRGQTIRAACLEMSGVTVAVSPGLDDVALLGQNFLRRFEVLQTARELRLRVRPGGAQPPDGRE
ncbi:MAG: retropepsin-like aspartic protease [Betaproteobacteria bacterium]